MPSFDRTPTFLRRLEPATRERAFWLIWLARSDGAPLVITEGRRSARRQAQLYAQGRTKPGPIVTNTLRSKHMVGRAFDIDFAGVHPDRVPIPWWEWAGRIGESLGLTWGGRWTMRDWRHFET